MAEEKTAIGGFDRQEACEVTGLVHHAGWKVLAIRLAEQRKNAMRAIAQQGCEERKADFLRGILNAIDSIELLIVVAQEKAREE